jgi:hypothetical protein
MMKLVLALVALMATMMTGIAMNDFNNFMYHENIADVFTDEENSTMYFTLVFDNAGVTEYTLTREMELMAHQITFETANIDTVVFNLVNNAPNSVGFGMEELMIYTISWGSVTGDNVFNLDNTQPW